MNSYNRYQCMNKLCNHEFSGHERKHLCRKCGDAFCKSCVTYKRKAGWDPETKLYKVPVCLKCFEVDQDSQCTAKSWTHEFKRYKSEKLSQRAGQKSCSESWNPTWRRKLDLAKECDRLIQGFRKSVGSSETKRTLQELKLYVSTPDWQKSSVWSLESQAKNCQECFNDFGLLHINKRTCKLCGKVLCTLCSKQELLVYIPNDVNQEAEPELAVIKVGGRPEKEPEISLLLHICNACRTYLTQCQISKAEKELKSLEIKEKEDVMSRLVVVDGNIREMQGQISVQLGKYQQIVVESFENRSEFYFPGRFSSILVLAKAQEDLTDHFASLVLKIRVLMKLQTVTMTDTQSVLLRNFIKSKSDFYFDNVFVFRTLKTKFICLTPPEDLQIIQKTVHKHCEDSMTDGMSDFVSVSHDLVSIDYTGSDTKHYERNEITTVHWVDSSTKNECMNKQCKMKFTVIDRKHHCRKCGDVFCKSCVSYKRRLNYLAHLDPEGKPYKVCLKCFEKDRDTQCTTKSWTNEFKRCKSEKYSQRTRQKTGAESLNPTWRNKLDLAKECDRLIQGFKNSFGSTETRRTLQEMKLYVSTPDWQKSSVWLQESTASKCQVCFHGFGLLNKNKRTCKLCGKVLCNTCSKRELLVYIPDDVNQNIKAEPELAVIKVVGSPEVEPEISLLLHICVACRTYLTQCQISKAEKELKSLEIKEKEDVMSRLVVVDGNIREMQGQITEQLDKYQETVESLENSSRSSSTGSNTKVLAKAQEDLSDNFASLVMKIQLLKKLQPAAETDTQKVLFKNYIKSKSDFYFDNIFTFRNLKKKLGDSAPPKVLETIQKIVDKHAIVSAQIYVRQLVFESLHLCSKHMLTDVIPTLLHHLDMTVEEETKACLQADQEDCSEHEEKLNLIIKSQIKDHRLVRLSKRQLAQIGSLHAAEILLHRTGEVLEQVHVQLCIKSINRSFQGTKKALKDTKQHVEKIELKKMVKSK